MKTIGYVIFLLLSFAIAYASTGAVLIPIEISQMVIISYILVMCAFFFNKRNTNPHFSPNIFPFFFSCYFLIGSLMANVNFHIRDFQWQLYVFALIGFYVGKFHFACIFGHNNKSLQNMEATYKSFIQNANIEFAFIIFCIAFSAQILLWLINGIPAFQKNVDQFRMVVAANGYLGTIASTKKPLAVFFFAYFVMANKYDQKLSYLSLYCFLVAILFSLFSGTRSDFLKIVIPCIVIYHYTIKRISISKTIVLTVIGFLFVGGIGFYRLFAKYGEGAYCFFYNNRIYSVPEMILYYSFTEVRTGVEGLSRVLERIPNMMDFQFGSLQISPLLMPLPGEQLPPGMIFKKLVGGTWEGFGMASTMIAPMYADFSVFGVVYCMAFYSYIIHYSFYKIKSSTEFGSYWLFAYSLIYYFIINGTRSNYVNFNFIWYLLIIFCLAFMKRNKSFVSKPTYEQNLSQT